MPPEIQAQPTAPQQPQALDPAAKNLAIAIRQSETGGDFNAVGDKTASHRSYGAYQFGEDTWNATAPRYGVNVPLRQATPEQQNEVAYKQIKDWKDQGYNVGQIASMWNAGKGEPDAYKGTFSNGQPSVVPGKFDVPIYAKSVATAYQTLKNGGQVGADPNNPSSTAAPQAQAQTSSNQPSIGGFLGNLAQSGGNFLGGIASAVTHPIDTLSNVANLGAGALEQGAQGLFNATGLNKYQKGGPINTPESQMAGNVGQFYKDRYGGLSNIEHTLYTDPVGAAADASTVLGGAGGLLGKVGEVGDLSGVSRAGELLSKAGEATNPVNVAVKGGGLMGELIGKAAGNTVGRTLGLETGVGYQPIQQAYQAGATGGDALKAFTEGLRGNTSPEELVGQAKDALGQVINQRSQSYQQMLSSLKGDSTTYNIQPIVNELDNQLGKFKIQTTPDGLDFSRSKFALDTTGQKDIENLYNYVKGYGLQAGDRTALGIDNLKQVLGGYYSPNSDYRSFVEGLRGSARKVLDSAPGYTEAMKNYSDMTDNIKEIQKSLSLGDKASEETAFKKLTGSLKNNDFRTQVLKDLDAATGGQLIPKISGERMSSLTPRGLSAYVTDAGIGGISGLAGGGILPLLGIAMTSSPRLVGEFVRALGIGLRGTKVLMDTLNKFSPQIRNTGLMGKLINEAQLNKH